MNQSWSQTFSATTRPWQNSRKWSLVCWQKLSGFSWNGLPKLSKTTRTTAVPGTQLFDALLVFVWLEVFMEGTSCPCAITQGDGQMWETNGNMSTCCHQGCATQWYLSTSRAEAASRCSLILTNKGLIAANGRNMVSSNFCFNLRLSSYWSVWERNWGTYSDIRPLLVPLPAQSLVMDRCFQQMLEKAL